MGATTESPQPAEVTPGMATGQRVFYVVRRALTPGRMALLMLALAAIYR